MDFLRRLLTELDPGVVAEVEALIEDHVFGAGVRDFDLDSLWAAHAGEACAQGFEQRGQRRARKAQQPERVDGAPALHEAEFAVLAEELKALKSVGIAVHWGMVRFFRDSRARLVVEPAREPSNACESQDDPFERQRDLPLVGGAAEVSGACCVRESDRELDLPFAGNNFPG